MKSLQSAYLLAAASLLAPVIAQTYTKCNPLSQTCPADPALGRSVSVDFGSGQSSEFSVNGVPSYTSDGAHLAVTRGGDSPTLISNWFMMFGHVEVVMKAAPGVGIVSSFVLQSDDLDEIDFEWLGGDNGQVQSNYFGKGQTGSYNRGAFHANPNNNDQFHTYTLDWTADQIVWQINGVTVRALTAAAAGSQFPQTPMQLKLGVWSGGDPANAQGTIQWAGGPTQYANGPFAMVVKSVKATDYSTGKAYSYGDNSGSWQSIKSNGGTINSKGGGNGAASPPPAAAAPSVTAISNGAPPFEGTHRSDSTYVKPSVYPWVPEATTLQTAVGASPTQQAGIPNLPSGWTVNSSGKVVPPSAAPSKSRHGSSISSSAAYPQGSSSGGSGYNESPENHGAAGITAGSSTLATIPTDSPTASIVPSTGAANNSKVLSGIGIICSVLASALLL